MPAARRSTGRSARRRARLRRRRLALTLGGSAAVAVLAVAGLTRLDLGAGKQPQNGDATTQARAVPPMADSPAPEPAAPSAPPASSAPPQSAPPTAPQVVQHGSGTFTTADASGGAVGTGSTLRRYRVEVENGIGITPKDAAAAVQAVLADKRSWTADKRNSFQLVSSGVYDFTVKIASPDTTDRICGAGGLNTQGEVNCDVGKQVVVNSKRWLTGSPQFDGTLDDYRALIVNHEVGHRIGHGHEGCPGPGKPAPAMMQQIYGLKGCTANAWPYDADGSYLSGPSVP
ncbi:DUF3152 domain-containing protein [Kitasatospora sp. NPDC059646]|uniref:DUF3152 domain-containing protein n=1 Tax=Kitasatospora sp. NPDC059646 TaxID=3346893 RepID=UPI0036C49B47